MKYKKNQNKFTMIKFKKIINLMINIKKHFFAVNLYQNQNNLEINMKKI